MAFSTITGITMTEAEIRYAKLTRAYIWTFVYTVIGSVIAVSLGVMLNKSGSQGGNFVLAAIFLVVWAFLTLYPAAVAIAFGIGGLSGLPKDWSINRLIREGALPDLQLSNVAKEGFALVQKYVRLSAHLAFFVTIVFVTLGTWRLENGNVVLPVFVVLSGIGLWATLFTEDAVWYKWVTIIILLAALVGLVYTGYTHTHPQDETVALIDETLVKNDDLIKEQAAKTLHEKVQRGIGLTPEEIRLLESLRHESKRVTSAISGVTASLPTVSFSSDNPAQQTWDLFKPVRNCSVGWNAEEGGPWCKAIIVPPGTYRIKPRFTGMWQHANTSRNGVLEYHNIPARGIMLRSIWDPIDEFYDEFLQMAPLGGNMWFGRLVARVGDKLIYDPYEHGGFTVTEPTKVLVGPNIPPLEQYISADKGDLPHDIQRLRQ